MSAEAPMFSRWERDTRYYELCLQQDLWGDWLLMRTWGKRGTAMGQIRCELCPDYVCGVSRYRDSVITRGKRGYVIVRGSV